MQNAFVEVLLLPPLRRVRTVRH
eukprot:COSAG06_NODE_47181_length_341_cov_0.640496_1_plen_22_part_10